MNYIQPIIKNLIKAGWFPSLLIVCGFTYVFILVLMIIYYFLYALCIKLAKMTK